ncbi:MAG: transglycosylase SLT domain-containing protein [Bacteroidales bacterium]|nr:transglycosylase SLT domain-containing protein [Candidatus Cryptobacteroides onthequi]MCQ2164957.1 transglycosylase SLT domain-containing protein [Bacteroidales bacterium]
MKRKALLLNLLAIVLGLLLAAGYSYLESRRHIEQGCSLRERELRCAMELGRYSDSTKNLTAGYNYAILKKFAADMNSEIEISLSLEGENYLDSLADGAVDIVVRPISDTTTRTDILPSDHVGDLARWVVDGNNEIALREINEWLEEYHESDEFKPVHDLYVKAIKNPFLMAENGGKVNQLSPYDSLFRVYSAKLGWQWKEFAALVYQESRFHIEALSWRGATGLLQMMPHTASRFDRDNLLDPEENIRAGVQYLLRLRDIFSKRVAGDQLDLFTMAAYNAGEGRIIDCINYAQYKNVYDSTWASICSILPDMADDAILEIDTVKVGKFSGKETMYFLDNILALQEAFNTICPE